MQIKYIPIQDLKPYENNARTHSDEQVQEIVNSIKRRGWTNPILLDGKNGIVAGHGRLMAAKKLGMVEVPTIDLSFSTDAEKAQYVIADNKIALNAGWDFDVLNVEFDLIENAGLDLTDTGFNENEIDEIRNPEVLNEGLCDEDDVPTISDTPISKPGDVWIMGNHRLMCGDSTMVDQVEKLMNGENADMVFTDPPYGISAVSNSGVLSKAYKKDIINDHNVDAAKDAYRLSESLGIPKLIFWGGNYYSSALPDSSAWLVWDKNNGQSDQMDAELAWTNLKGVTRKFTKCSEKINRVHPTQKPVELVTWALGKYDAGNVLDLFGGSGTTLIACEKTNRKCYMMEISPNYCDVIIKRWEEFTGKKAILESTKQTFSEVVNG